VPGFLSEFLGLTLEAELDCFALAVPPKLPLNKLHLGEFDNFRYSID
jgi:hypothetical protein